ncbi:MAG: energy-coupled thiamine transporter ThiT [Ruminococcus sp.]|jgi:thiamine transporter|nr:energy-coupled thiamine transporter ThiT [Ruminococcus sp.]
MKNTKKLVTTAMLIALATVLSLIPIITMPMGGTVTLLSMLPICVISIKYGVKQGLIGAFLYALIQLALGFSQLMGWGMNAATWIGCIVFDYIAAFTVLGLAGIFCTNEKKSGVSIIAGITLVLILRFISHFISGTIFFANWAPEDWNAALYSIVYNGTYMLPELIFTLIAACTLFYVPGTKKLVVQN